MNPNSEIKELSPELREEMRKCYEGTIKEQHEQTEKRKQMKKWRRKSK